VDFLNVGPWELIVVLIIAILVAGPQRMVEIARTLGRASRQLRDLSREFTTALQTEIQAVEKEAGRSGPDLSEVRQDLEDALSGSLQPQPEAEAGRSGTDLSQVRQELDDALSGSPQPQPEAEADE
jgi:Sec-independent protein translocase protein TatA